MPDKGCPTGRKETLTFAAYAKKEKNYFTQCVDGSICRGREIACPG